MLVFRMELSPGCVRECPACPHRELTPEQSKSEKLRWLKRDLSAWEHSIQPVRGGVARLHYREKVCLHAEWQQDHWAFGLLRPKRGNFKQKREKSVIDIPNCPIHAATVNTLIAALRTALPERNQFPLVYLAVSGKLATFVLKTKECPPIPLLDWSALGLEGLYVNLNPAAGNRVFFNRGWKLIWGKQYSVENGKQYGPESFRQQISGLHQEAMTEAAAFLNPGPGDGVVDLCSGIGESLLLWKNLGAQSIGVELNYDALNCCATNVGQSAALRGRVSERIPQLNQWIANLKIASNSRQNILIYANPPRLGLEPAVTEWIASTARPARIAYLSCNPKTLALDLNRLSSEYSVNRIAPYDFFPRTKHVEVLALLSHRYLNGVNDRLIS